MKIQGRWDRKRGMEESGKIRTADKLGVEKDELEIGRVSTLKLVRHLSSPLLDVCTGGKRE